jgi:hypothetical protein
MYIVTKYICLTFVLHKDNHEQNINFSSFRSLSQIDIFVRSEQDNFTWGTYRGTKSITLIRSLICYLWNDLSENLEERTTIESFKELYLQQYYG